MDMGHLGLDGGAASAGQGLTKAFVYRYRAFGFG